MGIYSDKVMDDREKAAICFELLTGITDRRTLIAIARKTDPNEKEPPKHIDAIASKWYNMDKVQTYRESLKRLLYQRDEQAREEGRQEERKRKEGEKTPKETPKNAADYNDPAQRRKLYNTIIIEAKDDPKTQLDAAKLIEQTQRDDRQAAQERKQTALFLPVSCDICPLMEREREKQARKK